jgi:hypothetical protein
MSVVWEADAARTLGVTPERLRGLRKTLADFMVTDGARRGYSPEGWSRLKDLLGLPKDDLPPPDTSPPKKELAVVLACCTNPNLLVAAVENVRILVRVKDNRLFVPNQQIPVRPPERDGGVWSLGCRHPVLRGRLP